MYFKESIKLLYISFSNILLKMGMRETGLLFDGSSGFPCLKIEITLAMLSLSGKIKDCKDCKD